MATPKVVQWTVVIVAEENENLTGTYRLATTTRLSELLQVWQDDFDLFGHWVFKSSNEEITYHDGSVTLEMVGETAPRMVYLIAAMADQLTSEIFVHQKNKCHHLFVEPHQKLYKVLSRLPGRPECLDSNGLPLNQNHSVQQAGLQNKSVIHNSLCSVAVKFSSGYTRVFQMSSDSFVLHLKEKVNSYENTDFSLKYQGRYLKSDENVRQLKQVVEVRTAEFFVNINKRLVRWRTKEEPIAFSEFISQLSIKADIDTERLKTLEFVCVGCERRICHSNDSIQLLPVECCKEKSLTLNVRPTSDTGMNEAVKHIQSLHEHLVQYRGMNPRTEGSRCVWREMKETFAAERLDYNLLTRCSESLLRRMNELNEKVKELEEKVETLTTTNEESGREIERLRTTNVEDLEEIEKLKEENKELGEEKMRLVEEKTKLYEEMEEKLGSKLLVIYDTDDFSPASNLQVQARGRCPWDTQLSYIKCQFPGIRAGSTIFEELRDILQRFVTGKEIRRILQWRGVAAGKEVTWATFRDKDEVAKPSESPYCGVDGDEHSSEEVETRSLQEVCVGGRVFICGRGRTVLAIFPH